LSLDFAGRNLGEHDRQIRPGFTNRIWQDDPVVRIEAKLDDGYGRYLRR
jgi:hypothetical protein